LSYRSSPRNCTFFTNIAKLPPGNALIKKGDDIQRKEFWTLKTGNKNYLSDEENFSQFKSIFSNAVHKRLISDVPLGVFLSGGIDSSSVVAIASQFSSQPVNTFCIGYSDGIDELPYAKIVSDQFQTNHQEIIIDDKNIESIIPKIVWHLDEPIADPAIIPTYLMSGQAKKKVSVVLLGEGADELLAGYPKYKLFSPWCKIIPQKLRYALYQYSPPSNVFDEREQKALLLKKACPDFPQFSKKYPNGKIELSALLKDDINANLPEYLLMKVDKMTMAHGLEARVPFLDHHLVEFSANLPDNLKLRGFNGKYILRNSMQNILPRSISKRPKKGFPMPLNSWLFGEMQETTIEIISNSAIIKQLFDRDQIHKILNRSINSYNPISKFRYTQKVWELMIFATWYNVYFKSTIK
jgi:asparagine synthase (glutamine-hydrolysing)